MNGRHFISRRNLLLTGAVALLPRAAAAASTSAVVVELFTSQGCSSCPPADAFAAELVQRGGVVALTYHVDYWDYLGWKDTLGSTANSQRQYDYAKARGDMDVYTPQMIVNGAAHFSGSNREGVLAAVADASSIAPAVGLALSATEAELAIEVGESRPRGETTLWLLPVVAEARVKILKGEIAGQEIVYHNVVRDIIPAGMWSGAAQRFRFPKSAVVGGERTGCVALLQQGKAGPLLACASWGALAA
jgi:hypothetical protein